MPPSSSNPAAASASISFDTDGLHHRHPYRVLPLLPLPHAYGRAAAAATTAAADAKHVKPPTVPAQPATVVSSPSPHPSPAPRLLQLCFQFLLLLRLHGGGGAGFRGAEGRGSSGGRGGRGERQRLHFFRRRVLPFCKWGNLAAGSFFGEGLFLCRFRGIVSLTKYVPRFSPFFFVVLATKLSCFFGGVRKTKPVLFLTRPDSLKLFAARYLYTITIVPGRNNRRRRGNAGRSVRTALHAIHAGQLYFHGEERGRGKVVLRKRL